MKNRKEAILQRAREIAAKDGLNFDELDEFWQKVYLHNGEQAIITETPPEQVVAEEAAVEPEVPPAEEPKAIEPPPVVVGTIDLPKEVEGVPDDNPNISGTGLDDTAAGSPDTSKPIKPRKPKARKKAAKRAG